LTVDIYLSRIFAFVPEREDREAAILAALSVKHFDEKQAGVVPGLSTLCSYGVGDTGHRSGPRENPLANTRDILPPISVLRQNRRPKTNPGQREAEL
jgi:hypothetical protein